MHPPTAEVRPAQARPEDLASLGRDWLTAVGRRWRLAGQLVLAEARLALGSFLLMIFCVTLAAGGVLFAWGFAILALGQVLRVAGMDLAVALVVLCLVHLGLAGALWQLSNRLGRHLEFEATRRLLELRDD